MPKRPYDKILNSTLLVVGIGYFADAFDVFLYNALRVPSLRELGLDGDALTRVGLQILNIQVAGMFAGGFIWGILGDKIGRKKALIGSILFYSFGSLGCAVVQNISLYATMRFLTGIGLAGEMGLGAILVVETLPDSKKDWGIAIYALFAYGGILGASLAAAEWPWRVCYAIGGVGGLALLLARMALLESGLYEQIERAKNVARGSLHLLLQRRDLMLRWLCCVFFMMPYFYVVNLLISLAPEFGKAADVTEPIKASIALIVYSTCAMAGTIATVLISRMLQKRILTVILFMGANLLLSSYYLLQWQPDVVGFYVLCGVMGLFNFFALLLFASVEQFGTNMRGMLGVSALSAGRTTLVITNVAFLALRGMGLDITAAAGWVAVLVFGVGLLCLFGLRETYHQGMDFLEREAI